MPNEDTLKRLDEGKEANHNLYVHLCDIIKECYGYTNINREQADIGKQATRALYEASILYESILTVEAQLKNERDR